MNENSDKEMEEFEEQIADEVGYRRKDENTRRRKTFLDFRPQRKTMILGGAGILLLIVLIALFSGGGSKLSTGDLSSIRVRFDQIEERLMRLEGVETRIAFLENREKGLQQSMAEADRSGTSLTQQLDELAQKINRLEKTVGSTPAETEAPYPIRRRPFPLTEGRYHEVRSGDTLYRIAQQYGISLDELCRLNNMTREQVIYPGDKLLVPPGSTQ